MRFTMTPLVSIVEPKGSLRVSMKKSSTPSDHMSLAGPLYPRPLPRIETAPFLPVASAYPADLSTSGAQ
eukprot:jgi/Chrpa1/24822/Chrysochromulina_OHIO_Genome00012873-RA